MVAIRDSISADGQVCYSNSADAAHANMAEQLALQPHHLISLDAMWQAAGMPVGKSPDAWAGLAKGLLAGLEDYAKRVHYGVIGAGPDLPFCGGPTITKTIHGVNAANEEVAGLYAQFLDNRGMMRCFVGTEDLEAAGI